MKYFQTFDSKCLSDTEMTKKREIKLTRHGNRNFERRHCKKAFTKLTHTNPFNQR